MRGRLCYNHPMKAQIVYIHGGNSYSKYENYLESLKTKTIWDPYGREPVKRWRDDIRTTFPEKADSLFPSMPNSQNAQYSEWKIWFERYFEYFTSNVVLIGHFLGANFLTKYLSEEQFPFHLNGLFLVAGTFDSTGLGTEDCATFISNPEMLPKILTKTNSIHLFHSKDDPIVPFEHALKYKQALPSIHLHEFTDRGHFIGPEFPEIIEEIRKVL